VSQSGGARGEGLSKARLGARFDWSQEEEIVPRRKATEDPSALRSALREGALGQELQRQVATLQAQIEADQGTFSRDLAKAQQMSQEAVTRAKAVERKALLEVDQERQQRQKAEKLLEKIRAQALDGQRQARDAALAQAQEIGNLKSRLTTVQDDALASKQASDAAQARIQRLTTELDAAVHRSTRFEAEANTIRAVIDRLTSKPEGMPHKHEGSA